MTTEAIEKQRGEFGAPGSRGEATRAHIHDQAWAQATPSPVRRTAVRCNARAAAALPCVSVHPERLEPAAAMYAFRASMECPVYLDLLRAGGHESAHGLDRIRCPVLLAWPAKDRFLPFNRYGRPPREALPSAELRTLHDVRHVPMLDDPTGIADLVRDLITRATGPGAFARSIASAPGGRRHPGCGGGAGYPPRLSSIRPEQPTDVAIGVTGNGGTAARGRPFECGRRGPCAHRGRTTIFSRAGQVGPRPGSGGL
jgi:hypothetical protein